MTDLTSVLLNCDQVAEGSPRIESIDGSWTNELQKRRSQLSIAVTSSAHIYSCGFRKRRNAVFLASSKTATHCKNISCRYQSCLVNNYSAESYSRRAVRIHLALLRTRSSMSSQLRKQKALEEEQLKACAGRSSSSGLSYFLLHKI